MVNGCPPGGVLILALDRPALELRVVVALEGAELVVAVDLKVGEEGELFILREEDVPVVRERQAAVRGGVGALAGAKLLACPASSRQWQPWP
eukprot:333445-Pyramimonas_sp.AAC.1